MPFARFFFCAVLALALTPFAGAAPRYDHVVVVIMENHGYAQVIGHPSAPYLTSLSQQGALFTNARGVAHPSQPNYLAIFAGSTLGIASDSCPHTFAGVDNLGAQLVAAGFSFAGYSESMPSSGYTGCSAGKYARKHNPWVNFPNVPAASNLPYSSFPTDYSTLSTVSFVIPDLISDMHDGTVATGDAWLKSNIDRYAQWAKTHNSLLVLTFDEDDYSSGNRIATMFVGAQIAPRSYDEPISHYNVLATIESIYGLPLLSKAAAPVSDVFAAANR
jgi:hypothetical protein